MFGGKEGWEEKARNRIWDVSRAGNTSGGALSWRERKSFIAVYGS